MALHYVIFEELDRPPQKLGVASKNRTWDVQKMSWTSLKVLRTFNLRPPFRGIWEFSKKKSLGLSTQPLIQNMKYQTISYIKTRLSWFKFSIWSSLFMANPSSAEPTLFIVYIKQFITYIHIYFICHLFLLPPLHL